MRRKHSHEPEQRRDGGNWKIAYADFITTMMGFFLLLWLLNITTEEQKKGLSEYFLGISNFVEPQHLIEKQDIETSSLASTTCRENASSDNPSIGDQKKPILQNQQLFSEAEQKLMKATKESPEFRQLAKHIITDKTKEGLRIQIIDHENQPLFDKGSPTLSPHAKKLVHTVAKIIKNIPNSVTVMGHTDSTPLEHKSKYTNWELSIDRANNVRQELLENGVASSRFSAVIGKESLDPLVPQDPASSHNRRVTIILEHLPKSK